jgi:hypothetical protein
VVLTPVTAVSERTDLKDDLATGGLSTEEESIQQVVGPIAIACIPLIMN